jgi:hypothetical protein
MNTVPSYISHLPIPTDLTPLPTKSSAHHALDLGYFFDRCTIPYRYQHRFRIVAYINGVQRFACERKPCWLWLLLAYNICILHITLTSIHPFSREYLYRDPNISPTCGETKITLPNMSKFDYVIRIELISKFSAKSRPRQYQSQN